MQVPTSGAIYILRHPWTTYATCDVRRATCVKRRATCDARRAGPACNSCDLPAGGLPARVTSGTDTRSSPGVNPPGRAESPRERYLWIGQPMDKGENHPKPMQVPTRVNSPRSFHRRSMPRGVHAGGNFVTDLPNSPVGDVPTGVARLWLLTCLPRGSG